MKWRGGNEAGEGDKEGQPGQDLEEDREAQGRQEGEVIKDMDSKQVEASPCQMRIACR